MPGSSTRPLPERDLDHVLEHTAGSVGRPARRPAVRDRRNGFLRAMDAGELPQGERRSGSSGATVTVLTRDPGRFAEAAPHIAEHGAVRSASPATSGHSTSPTPGAAMSFTWRQRPARACLRAASFRTAVAGTERVLAFASGRGARKLLLTSSGAVYGTQPTDLERIPEDYLGAPRPEDASAGYGHGKRAAEYLCAVAAAESGSRPRSRAASRSSGQSCLWTPTSRSATSSAMRSFETRIEVRGDGTARRSYLYAADLAVWLWTILIKGESGPALQRRLGGGREHRRSCPPGCAGRPAGHSASRIASAGARGRPAREIRPLDSPSHGRAPCRESSAPRRSRGVDRRVVLGRDQCVGT